MIEHVWYVIRLLVDVIITNPSQTDCRALELFLHLEGIPLQGQDNTITQGMRRNAALTKYHRGRRPLPNFGKLFMTKVLSVKSDGVTADFGEVWKMLFLLVVTFHTCYRKSRNQANSYKLTTRCSQDYLESMAWLLSRIDHCRRNTTITSLDELMNPYIWYDSKQARFDTVQEYELAGKTSYRTLVLQPRTVSKTSRVNDFPNRTPVQHEAALAFTRLYLELHNVFLDNTALIVNDDGQGLLPPVFQEKVDTMDTLLQTYFDQNSTLDGQPPPLSHQPILQGTPSDSVGTPPSPQGTDGSSPSAGSSAQASGSSGVAGSSVHTSGSI